MRIGWLSPICRPAMRLPSTGRAAKPAMMPTTPAEASRLAPTWRTAGKVINIRDTPISTTRPCDTRDSTSVCVWMRRATRLSEPTSGLASITPRATPCTARASSQVTTPISSSAVQRSAPGSQATPVGTRCHTGLSASR